MIVKLVIEKAEPTTPDKPVEDVMISIHRTGELDDCTPGQARAVYQTDARDLCDVLHSALPGGTFAELLSCMLEKRTCHFKVSFGDLEKKGD